LRSDVEMNIAVTCMPESVNVETIFSFQLR
jgi:hypothetical protein